MKKISSGIPTLDALIDSFYVGDNVVWELEAGTSFSVFIRNFIVRSIKDEQNVIYISFNRSPQTIIGDLRDIVSMEHFTLIDCFTAGKGKNDSTFLKFYNKGASGNVVKIDDPGDINSFTSLLNGIEDRFPPGARYVFDSLTGMQDLWGDDGKTHRFFTYMCPRLYDLGTVAYWILEKEAHSQRFKANLRHITQVVLDLAKRKNNLFVKALKLEGRQDREAFKAHPFDIRGDVVTIAPQKREVVPEIGGKLKEERIRIGMSQKELAEHVSVTPSFLSQLESNQVSPSLSTFLLICRTLGIDPGRFLSLKEERAAASWLLRKRDIASRPPLREDDARIYEVFSGDRYSVRIVVLPPGAAMNRHFFYQKEQELIYVVRGDLSVTVDGREERIGEGDVVLLKETFPSLWKNEGGVDARLLVIW